MGFNQRMKPWVAKPGEYEKMEMAIRRAMLRHLPGRNGDAKAGLAYACLTLAGSMARDIQIYSDKEDVVSHTTGLIFGGYASEAGKAIHELYYTLVENYVIKADDHYEDPNGQSLKSTLEYHKSVVAHIERLLGRIEEITDDDMINNADVAQR